MTCNNRVWSASLALLMALGADACGPPPTPPDFSVGVDDEGGASGDAGVTGTFAIDPDAGGDPAIDDTAVDPTTDLPAAGGDETGPNPDASGAPATDAAGETGESEEPDVPDQPEIGDGPDSTDEADVPELPDASDEPEVVDPQCTTDEECDPGAAGWECDTSPPGECVGTRRLGTCVDGSCDYEQVSAVIDDDAVCFGVPCGGISCAGDDALPYACGETGWCELQDQETCDDGNECTADSCVQWEGCAHEWLGGDGCICPGPGVPCPPGFACSNAEHCISLDGARVYVPPGATWLGCLPADGCSDGAGTWELFLEGFAIDRFEVTVADWKSCVNSASCSTPALFPGVTIESAPNLGKPAHHITLDEATEYCAAQDAQLCSEAQWEYSARGRCGSTATEDQACLQALPHWPWGSEAPTCGSEAVFETAGGDGCGTGDAFDVGGRPESASQFGAQDMVGNGSEWVLSDGGGGPAGTTKGGAYIVGVDELSIHGVYNPKNDEEHDVVGFRCCHSAPEFECEPADCDDGNACTADTCLGDATCSHVAIPGCTCPGIDAPCPAGFSCEEETYCLNNVTDQVWVPGSKAFITGCIQHVDAVTCAGAPALVYHEPADGDLPANGFAIDRYEVTVAKFLACGADCQFNDPVQPFFADHQPMTNVSFSDAAIYCEEQGRQLCPGLWWEVAARGVCPDGASADSCEAQTAWFPWGNDPLPSSYPAYCDLAVWKGGDGAFDTCYAAPLAPGSKENDRSPFGVHDMAGNVREMATDDGGFQYSYRGSGYDNIYSAQLYSHQYAQGQDAPDGSIGFRCCESLD